MALLKLVFRMIDTETGETVVPESQTLVTVPAGAPRGYVKELFESAGIIVQKFCFNAFESR